MTDETITETIEPKHYCSCIVENRLSNRLFDTILQHRSMLPEWWSHCHINDPSVKTLNDYNRLLTSRKFWQQFERFDRVLIFQHDSRILRKGIEDFLQYDFIGAPLYHIPFPAMNGGLSLRNPAKMIQLIDEWPYNVDKYGNEDIYFSAGMQIIDGALPNFETAMSFSVETIFYDKPWGVHAPEKWLEPQQLEVLGL